MLIMTSEYWVSRYYTYPAEISDFAIDKIALLVESVSAARLGHQVFVPFSRVEQNTRVCHPVRLNAGTIQRIGNDPDSKVHGANMVPTWVLSAHSGPMNLAIRGPFY